MSSHALPSRWFNVPEERLWGRNTANGQEIIYAMCILQPFLSSAHIPKLPRSQVSPGCHCGQTPLLWGKAMLGIALPPRPLGGCWGAGLLWNSLSNSPAQAAWTQNAEPPSWLWGEEDLPQERMGKPCLGDPRRGLSGASRFWPLAIFLLRHERRINLSTELWKGSLEHWCNPSQQKPVSLGG